MADSQHHAPNWLGIPMKHVSLVTVSRSLSGHDSGITTLTRLIACVPKFRPHIGMVPATLFRRTASPYPI